MRAGAASKPGSIKSTAYAERESEEYRNEYTDESDTLDRVTFPLQMASGAEKKKRKIDNLALKWRTWTDE